MGSTSTCRMPPATGCGGMVKVPLLARHVQQPLRPPATDGQPCLSPACLGPPLQPERRPSRVDAHSSQFAECPTWYGGGTLCNTLPGQSPVPLPLQTKRYDVNVELDGYNHDLR